ncbi:ArdC-like ssDNA-binding domain-containing protein [Nocardioides sp. NBC_00368]|uniref:ArdC family protein n=1 Tax=Nocardioides sp. NBC_00368 TaxID=2976000 RepID=UPI002E1B0A1E
MPNDNRTNEQRTAERSAKLDALHERLTAAVEGLVTGDDWRRAMEFGARFRSRSFRNSRLIEVQHLEAYNLGMVPHPFPTYVAGFRQWQSLGRSVIKGSHSYQIFAPVTGRFASTTPTDAGSWRRLTRGEHPRPGEAVRSKIVGVKLAHVFDVSMTAGDPLPEVPQPKVLAGEAPDGLWDGLADQITERGYGLRLVSNRAAIGGANGITDHLNREVSVRVDMDEAAMVKTAAHELAHVIQGVQNVDGPMHRGIAEVEAESVALMIGAAHGMDTSDYTIPYVATWADRVSGQSPVEVVQATAERVRRIATTILDKLDTPKINDGAPPGLDRTRPEPTRSTDTIRPLTSTGPSEAIGL